VATKWISDISGINVNQASLQKLAPRYITIALAIVALIFLSLNGYAFWRGYQDLKRTVSTKAVVDQDQSSERPIASIVDLNLFGKKEDKATIVAIVTEDLPETNLKLILRGISATNADDSSGALIEGPDRQTEFFRIGDNMPGNAVLHAVFANRVVIDRNGRFENLYFPESRGDDGRGIETYDDPSKPLIEELYEEPIYPEPEYIEPDYENPDAEQPTNDANPALNGINEQRREEIRNRLRQLREQIKNQNEN